MFIAVVREIKDISIEDKKGTVETTSKREQGLGANNFSKLTIDLCPRPLLQPTMHELHVQVAREGR